MFAVTCPIGEIPADQLDFPTNTIWPQCVIEPICDQLPTPSEESMLEKTTVEDSVKLGEYVEYGCIRRSEFFETPVVSTIHAICKHQLTTLINHFVFRELQSRYCVTTLITLPIWAIGCSKHPTLGQFVKNCLANAWLAALI